MIKVWLIFHSLFLFTSTIFLKSEESFSGVKNYLEIRALQGDTLAQVQLGYKALNSEKPDYDTALLWLSLAAEKGHPKSCFWLGSMYKVGFGTPANISKSIEIWQKGAAFGSLESMNELQILYYQNKNYPRMYAWHDLILETSPNYKFNSLSIDEDLRQKQIQLIETEKNKINDLLEQIRTYSSILHSGNKKGVVQKDDSRFGIKESNEGERYIGESKNGLEEGFGRFYNKEGQLIHEGFWKKGVPLR